MKNEKNLLKVKIVNLISGLLILGISIWMLLDSGAAVDFFITMIAIALVVLGIARIIVGTSHDELKKSAKFVKISSGIIAVIIGLSVNLIHIRWPTVSIIWLYLLAAAGLLVIGFARFFRGLQARQYPLWYRIIILIAGCASIVISILIGMTNLNVVLIIPENIQIILFAITLMLLAISRISLLFLQKPEQLKKT